MPPIAAVCRSSFSCSVLLTAFLLMTSWLQSATSLRSDASPHHQLPGFTQRMRGGFVLHVLKKKSPPPVETPLPPRVELPSYANGITTVALLLGLFGIPAFIGVEEKSIIFLLHVTDAITALLNAGHFLASVCATSARDQSCFARNMAITHSIYVVWVLYLAFIRSLDSADLPLFVTGTVCILILGLTKGCGATIQTSDMWERFMMRFATHMLWLLYMLSYLVAFQEGIADQSPQVHHAILATIYMLLGFQGYITPAVLHFQSLVTTPSAPAQRSQDAQAENEP